MAEGDKARRRFTFQIKPFAQAVSQLKADGPQGVDPKVVAEAIREHGAAAMPPELQSWLSDWLDGKIRPKRGRPKDDKLGRHIAYMFKRERYDQTIAWLQAREKRYGHINGWSCIRDAGWWQGPPSERAARMVAERWSYGHRSWRSLLTELSKKSR